MTDPTSIAAEELTFAGAGGTPVNGYLAAPAEGPARASRAAMIVIHEAGGLNEHIRDVTNRFANLGYVALGVDLYTREGGPPPAGDLQALMERLFSMSDETVLGDLEGAADFLRAREDVSEQDRLHRLLHGRALHAAVRVRERPAERRGRLLGRLHRQSHARRALHAGAPDAAAGARRTAAAARCSRRSAPRTRTPRRSSAEQLRERAAASGQEVKVDVYEGAGHAFFADYRPDLPSRAAAALLWQRDRAVPAAPPARRLRRDARALALPSDRPEPERHVHIVRRRNTQARREREMLLERKWWTLIAVCLAIFMLLLDITVVNVALPDIQRSLHSSFSDLQWVINAYALTLAAFLLTSGSVADLIGRKRVFVAGLFVFTASSAVCGLSTTPLMLNLARAVQGTGGAMMFATSLALIAQAFRGKDRGTAFGVFGAVTGAAVAVGPVLGGVITSGIGWEWIFFVNVPIGAIAVFVTLTQVADSRDPERHGRGLGRPGDLLGVAVPARVRARAGQRKGLGLDRDRLAADRRRRPAGHVRDRRAPPDAGRCSI